MTFQKWNEWKARKLEEIATYEVQWKIDLDDMIYLIKAIVSFKDNEVYKLVVTDVEYMDSLGKIKVNAKTKAKIKRLIKQYLIGTPETGLFFNRGFKAKLKQIIPQGGEDESLLGI